MEANTKPKPYTLHQVIAFDEKSLVTLLAALCTRASTATGAALATEAPDRKELAFGSEGERELARAVASQVLLPLQGQAAGALRRAPSLRLARA